MPDLTHERVLGEWHQTRPSPEAYAFFPLGYQWSDEAGIHTVPYEECERAKKE